VSGRIVGEWEGPEKAGFENFPLFIFSRNYPV